MSASGTRRRINPREDELTLEAEYLLSRPPIDDDVAEMVRCRVVDNAAAALAAINRQPAALARAMALAHPHPNGATLFGLNRNHRTCRMGGLGAAVRELDFRMTRWGHDFGHPGDNIVPLIAVAQQTGKDGAALVRSAAIAYEVHVALMKGISLHAHKKDHVAHLLPSTVAGLGALLDLPIEVVYHAINQAVHLGIFDLGNHGRGDHFSRRTSLGIRARRPSRPWTEPCVAKARRTRYTKVQISVIAWMLDGTQGAYTICLPAPGKAPRGIMETYTKAHSAEYQAQALIDLACEVREDIDVDEVDQIILHTSHHTHSVIHRLQRSSEVRSHGEPRNFRPLGHVHPGRGVGGRTLASRGQLCAPSSRGQKRCRFRTRSKLGKTRLGAPLSRSGPSEACIWRAAGGNRGTARSLKLARMSERPQRCRAVDLVRYVRKFDALMLDVIDASERDRFIVAASGLDELSADEIGTLNPICRPISSSIPNRLTGDFRLGQGRLIPSHG